VLVTAVALVVAVALVAAVAVVGAVAVVAAVAVVVVVPLVVAVPLVAAVALITALVPLRLLWDRPRLRLPLSSMSLTLILAATRKIRKTTPRTRQRQALGRRFRARTPTASSSWMCGTVLSSGGLWSFSSAPNVTAGGARRLSSSSTTSPII